MSHPSIPKSKTALLLVNLGTPDSTSTADVRRYLKEFLSDERVIELQSSFVGKVLWQSILRGIILNLRPRKSAAAYKEIWFQETDESPLRYYTCRQAELLQEQMGDIVVSWAMRYGAPSIGERLGELKAQGCDKIAVIALYPQYSATTSASVYDEVFRVLQSLRWQPAVRTAEPWHDDSLYIEALAKSARGHLQGLDWQPDVILTSYHGLPKTYFEKGDPYYCQCAKTTRLLGEELGQELKLTFQSRFGLQEWLTPYTDKVAVELAKAGKKKIAVLMPGFASDCLETLEEINIALRRDFLATGGTHFAAIPCLNDSPEGLEVLAHIAKKQLAGWI